MENYQEYPLSKFKAHLSDMIDAVEAGKTLMITRHGRQVAKIMPPKPVFDREAMDRATESMKRRKAEIAEDWKRRGLKPLTIEEIIAMKNEGRR